MARRVTVSKTVLSRTWTSCSDARSPPRIDSPMPPSIARTFAALPLLLLAACSAGRPTAAPAGGPSGAQSLEPVARADFNRVAAELMLPLFWIEDTDKNGRIDPSELAVLWGMVDTKEEDWVQAGAFTPAFL